MVLRVSTLIRAGERHFRARSFRSIAPASSHWPTLVTSQSQHSRHCDRVAPEDSGAACDVPKYGRMGELPLHGPQRRLPHTRRVLEWDGVCPALRSRDMHWQDDPQFAWAHRQRGSRRMEHPQPGDRYYFRGLGMRYSMTSRTRHMLEASISAYHGMCECSFWQDSIVWFDITESSSARPWHRNSLSSKNCFQRTSVLSWRRQAWTGKSEYTKENPSRCGRASTRTKRVFELFQGHRPIIVAPSRPRRATKTVPKEIQYHSYILSIQVSRRCGSWRCRQAQQASTTE